MSYTRIATTNAEITVPKKANAQIAPKFEKKGFYRISRQFKVSKINLESKRESSFKVMTHHLETEPRLSRNDKRWKVKEL